MKIVSIIMLTFVLSLSHTVMAETAKKMPDAKAFQQAKEKILQGVSNHIEVLNKFKSCVAMAKKGTELNVCKMAKNTEIKKMRMKNKKARSKKVKAKKMEVKPLKPAE